MNSLGNKYAFSALKAKRAELSGKLKALDKQAKALKAELAHLDATMRLFDPSFDPRTVKPAKTPRIHLFKQGELGRLILDALRRADGEPLSAAAIADAVADTIGQPEARAIIARRVRANLAYMERRRLAVEKVGEREAAHWRLRVCCRRQSKTNRSREGCAMHFIRRSIPKCRKLHKPRAP